MNWIKTETCYPSNFRLVLGFYEPNAFYIVRRWITGSGSEIWQTFDPFKNGFNEINKPPVWWCDFQMPRGEE